MKKGLLSLLSLAVFLVLVPACGCRKSCEPKCKVIKKCPPKCKTVKICCPDSDRTKMVTTEDVTDYDNMQ